MGNSSFDPTDISSWNSVQGIDLNKRQKKQKSPRAASVHSGNGYNPVVGYEYTNIDSEDNIRTTEEPCICVGLDNDITDKNAKLSAVSFAATPVSISDVRVSEDVEVLLIGNVQNTSGNVTFNVGDNLKEVVLAADKDSPQPRKLNINTELDRLTLPPNAPTLLDFGSTGSIKEIECDPEKVFLNVKENGNNVIKSLKEIIKSSSGQGIEFMGGGKINFDEQKNNGSVIAFSFQATR